MTRHFYEVHDPDGKLMAEIVAVEVREITVPPPEGERTYHEIVSSPVGPAAFLTLPKGAKIKMLA